MDLPTCPSCGQSVLDDDAAECPFCGSSMPAPRTAEAPKSVKPSPRTVAAKTAPKSAAAVSPVAKSETRRPARAEGKTDDEIITADKEALKRAYPLRRKPAKGCNYKVICPMCEAPGYIPPKAAGQDVKCHNPACMVPIFTAPVIEKKPAPEPEGSGLSLFVYVGIVLGVLVLGVGCWFVFLRHPPGTGGAVQVSSGHGGETAEVDEEAGEESPDTDVETDQTPSLDEVQRAAMKVLIKSSQRVSSYRKPFARRWCAEAVARMGDLDEARKQIRQLETVGKTLPFLKTIPLVEIGWQQLKSGHQDELDKTLTAANKSARTLRPQGRFRYEAAMSLASLLAAAGRDNDARKLIAQHTSSSLGARLATTVFVAENVIDFDFSAAERFAPIGGWHAPQYSVVSAALAARGHLELSLNWAKQAANAEIRTEATMAWAEMLIRRSDEQALRDNLSKVREEIAQLSTPGQALLLGRIAAVHSAAGRKDVAAPLLAAAVTALDRYEVPPPLIFTDKRAIITCRFPSQALVRLAARASAEIARLQIALGKTDAGLASLDRGLQFARAMAPSPVYAQSCLDEISSIGASGMRQKIQGELGLANLNQATQHFSDYNHHCRRLRDLANARFDLQIAMIEASLSANSLDGIAALIRTSDSVKASALREPFMATKLPWLLAARYEAADLSPQADQMIEDAVAAGADPSGKLWVEARGAIAKARFRDAARALSHLKVAKEERSRLVLSLLADLVRDNRWESAMRICMKIEQDSLREEGLMLTSAQASALGHADGVFTFAEREKPSPLGRVFIHAGIVLGIVVERDKQSAANRSAANPSATPGNPSSE